MSDINAKQWGSIFLIVFIIMASLVGLMYLATRFLPSGPGNTASQSTPPSTAADRPLSVSDVDSAWSDDTGTVYFKTSRRKLLLLRDHEVKIGKIVIMYRGLNGSNKFTLDVIILNFDPEAIYTRRLNIASAKKGFTVGDENFELISAKKSNMRIWHYQ